MCVLSCIIVSHCLTDRWNQCSEQPGSSLVEDDSASFIPGLGKIRAAKSHLTLPLPVGLHMSKLNCCAKQVIFLEFTHYSTLANIQIFSFIIFIISSLQLRSIWNFKRGSNMESYPCFFFLRCMVSYTKTVLLNGIFLSWFKIPSLP